MKETGIPGNIVREQCSPNYLLFSRAQNMWRQTFRVVTIVEIFRETVKTGVGKLAYTGWRKIENPAVYRETYHAQKRSDIAETCTKH